MPYPDFGSSNHFPVVKCVLFFQQVCLLINLETLFLVCILEQQLTLSLMLLRSPPKIPKAAIPEDIVVDVASALRTEINSGLAILREIASGRDVKNFLAVCYLNSLCFQFVVLLVNPFT